MNRRQRRPILVVLGALLCFFTAAPVRAQLSNLEAFQELARGCLGVLPDSLDTLVVEAPADMPYLRTALVQAWQQQGRTLYVTDTLAQKTTGTVARLRYAVEEAHVDYARNGRGRLHRTVTLALRYSLTAPDGRLLREAHCRDTFRDVIRRTQRSALENQAFPETQGTPPAGSWRRRYLEPAILAAATAVTVYLFFSLRSERETENP